MLGAVRRLGLFLIAVLLGGAGYFFFFLAHRVDRSSNRVVATGLPPLTKEAIQLHSTLAVADLHDDLLLWPRSVVKRSDRGQVDLERLIEGKVALEVFSVVTKTPRKMNYQRNDSSTD